MTRKELMKLIEDEVTKVATEPMREPIKRLPIKNVSKINQESLRALKDEGEVDNYLFKAGMKD